MADQLRDCFSAFKWVSTNIEKYGGDLNNVFVTGDSAGGFWRHIALLNSSDKLRKIFGVTESGLEFRACGLTSPVCFMNTHTFQDVYYSRVKGKEFSESTLRGFENFDAVIKYGFNRPTFLVTSAGVTSADCLQLRCIIYCAERALSVSLKTAINITEKICLTSFRL